MTAQDKLDSLLLDYRDELTPWEAEAFVDMASWLGEDTKRKLSAKQVKAVESACDRIIPQYENLASSGKLTLGKPVVTPECLKRENLPMKPPGRR